jgi:hypothetical protein
LTSSKVTLTPSIVKKNLKKKLRRKNKIKEWGTRKKKEKRKGDELQ